MAKILLANIGNRNLVEDLGNEQIGSLADMKKQPIGYLEKNQFKTLTKGWLQDIKKDNALLDLFRINILNAVLEKEKGFDKIYLFASNQSSANSEKETRQDTIYAAEIIQLILGKSENFSKVEVNIIKMAKNPSKVDEQILEFREKMTDILSSHSNDEIIICDSGGTPQQKSALKLVTEYVLNKTEKLKFYQVVDNSDDVPVLSQKDDAKPQSLYQYRQIIDAQQIELLIDKGEYCAASSIRASSLKEKNEEFKDDEMWKVLQFWYFRLEDRRKDAKKCVQEMMKEDIPATEELKEKYKLLDDFKKNKTVGKKQALFTPVLNGEDYKILCDIFSIADFHFYTTKDYTKSIHAFYVFIERFANILVDKYYISDFKSKIDNNDFNLRNDIHLPNHIRLSKKNPPIRLAYLKRYHSSKMFINLVDSFIQINGTLQQTTEENVKRGEALKCQGIDQLRHKIMHDFEGTDLIEIDTYSPNFEKHISMWRKELGMPLSVENVFVKANEEIKQALKTSYKG